MSNRPRGGPDGVQPPRRRRRARRAWTKRRRTAFLKTLAESCNVSAAARAAGMDRSSAYDLKDRDPEFQRGWGKALEQAHSELGWRLLQICKDGAFRTELSFDLKTREPKHLKVTRTDAVTVMVRLYDSHQAEVSAFRVAEGRSGDEEDVGARVRAHMDLLRKRLIDQAVVAECSNEA